MRWNHHLNNHFGSCRLLGKGYDPYRKRDIEVRALPGEFELVGITDGTDSFVTGVNTPFLAPYKRLLDEIRQGNNPQVITTRGRRERASLEEGPAPETEVRVRRARAQLDDDDVEIRPRTRRSVSA